MSTQDKKPDVPDLKDTASSPTQQPIENTGFMNESTLPVGVPVPWPSEIPRKAGSNVTVKHLIQQNIRNLPLPIHPADCLI
ncbi:phage tail protein [Xenorhabdus budapestensis]|uniref:Phage tail protein n=1 Tax=Xenorhabdus budapestensis TaxID=290110 RepID=A0A2D0IK90_XENBU|nr:hypothetical protein [Xenorhabdus budapestensis]PHM22186.1 phage tail protein [Xenorhabdus budapestensis]